MVIWYLGHQKNVHAMLFPSECKHSLGRVLMPSSELSHTVQSNAERRMDSKSINGPWPSLVPVFYSVADHLTSVSKASLGIRPRCLVAFEPQKQCYIDLNLLFSMSACIYFCCNIAILLLNLLTVFKQSIQDNLKTKRMIQLYTPVLPAPRSQSGMIWGSKII